MKTKFAILALSTVLLTGPALAQREGPPRPQLPPLALNGQMTDAQIGAALDPWLAGLRLTTTAERHITAKKAMT